MIKSDTITAVDGLFVGQREEPEARTGCTVVLFDKASPVAYEVRGGWPGTYDTDSTGTGKAFFMKHAIFLTGGDVFGFDCASGIRRFLVEKGVASDTSPERLPGVVGANIYDIGFADVQRASYRDLGYEACRAASQEPVKEGNHGAGIGATVAKLRGLKYGFKGGIGSCALKVDDIVVGALVVTNALGNIFDFDSGAAIAASRREDGSFATLDEAILEYSFGKQDRNRATTLAVIATNVTLGHEYLTRFAQMASCGFALAIRPVHMMYDGDTIFAVSTARLTVDIPVQRAADLVGSLGAQAVARAIVRSVRKAETLAGVPGLASLGR